MGGLVTTVVSPAFPEADTDLLTCSCLIMNIPRAENSSQAAISVTILDSNTKYVFYLVTDDTELAKIDNRSLKMVAQVTPGINRVKLVYQNPWLNNDVMQSREIKWVVKVEGMPYLSLFNHTSL